MKLFVPAMRLILLLCFAVLLLSACEGNQRPADQIATIGSIGPNANLDYLEKSLAYWLYQSSLHTFILEIDGQKLNLDDVNSHVSLEVLPGEHQMEVAANVGGKSIDALDPLIFLAEAGESYLVIARSEEGSEENQILLYFWVVDSSGEVVAGTKDVDN